MTDKDTANGTSSVAKKCQNCHCTFATSAHMDEQYNWEQNGFCSFGCEADYMDFCIRYERRLQAINNP
jgi:hypothetical protein